MPNDAIARQPKANVLNEIQTLLHGYSSDTLVRELIQNADDAGSSSVEIQHRAISCFPDPSPWNGPSLLISNNGPLSEEDFRNLGELRSTAKADRPLKVGRFGVGKVALFAVGYAHLIRGWIDNSQAPSTHSPLTCADEQQLSQWDLDPAYYEPHGPLGKIFSADCGQNRLQILVPLKNRDWSGRWLLNQETALPLWRAVAQMLPLLANLKEIKVLVEGEWSASWTLDGTRRSPHLLTPEAFGNQNRWPANWREGVPDLQNAENVKFAGRIIEYQGNGSGTEPTNTVTTPYAGWECRLPLHRAIDNVAMPPDAGFFPRVPHAAVLRIGESNESLAIRKAMFLGLGGVQSVTVDGMAGLILHVNGYCDDKRMDLEGLEEPTDGRTYQGGFNRYLITTGIFTLLKDALGKYSGDLRSVLVDLAEHPWTRKIWNANEHNQHVDELIKLGITLPEPKRAEILAWFLPIWNLSPVLRGTLRSLILGLDARGAEICQLEMAPDWGGPEGTSALQALKDWVEARREAGKWHFLSEDMSAAIRPQDCTALGINTLTWRQVVEDLKHEIRQPRGTRVGRPGWATAVLEAAERVWGIDGYSDWLQLPLHGPNHDTPWRTQEMNFRVLAANAIDANGLRKAAEALGIVLVERPFEVSQNNQYWEQLQSDFGWTVKTALNRAWHQLQSESTAVAAWAATLLDWCTPQDLIAIHGNIPTNTGVWVVDEQGNGRSAQERTKARCAKLLNAKIDRLVWHSQVPEHVSDWRSLPYHLSPASNTPTQWGATWFYMEGAEEHDPSLREAAKIHDIRLMNAAQCPFAQEDPSYPFWNQIQNWNTNESLTRCLRSSLAGSIPAQQWILNYINQHGLANINNQETIRRLATSPWMPTGPQGAPLVAPRFVLDRQEWPKFLPPPPPPWHLWPADVEPPITCSDFWVQAGTCREAGALENALGQVAPINDQRYVLLPAVADIEPHLLADFVREWVKKDIPQQKSNTWLNAWNWARWVCERTQGEAILPLIQLQQLENPFFNHWPKGFRAIQQTNPKPGSPGWTCALAILQSFHINEIFGFKTNTLPDTRGNWRNPNTLAQANQATPISQQLHPAFEACLLAQGRLKANPVPPLTKDDAQQAMEARAQIAGEEAPQVRLLLGTLLAWCSTDYDGAAANLLQGSHRTLEDLRSSFAPHPDNTIINCPDEVLALDGSPLSVEPDTAPGQRLACWRRQDHEVVLAPSGFTFSFEDLRRSLAELTNEPWFQESDNFLPDQLDAHYQNLRILQHIPLALQAMDRWMQPGEASQNLSTMLEDLQKRQTEVEGRLHEENYQAAMDANQRRRDCLQRLQNQLIEGAGEHQALVGAARSYIQHLGYSEERVLFELFQNADDATSQAHQVNWALPEEPTFQVNQEDNTLTVSYPGRPIGLWRGGDSKWKDDLIYMLSFHGSGKRPQDASRGLFGLGFKSVYLVSNEPRIDSWRVHARIRGALLPIQEENEDRPETRIQLPLLAPRSVERDMLDPLRRMALPLLAFSRTIKRIALPGNEVFAWDPEQEFGDARWHCEKSPRGRHVIFLYQGDEICTRRKNGPTVEWPTIWALAPTKVHWGGFPLLLNGRFKLDTGRTEVQGANPHNLKEFRFLGMLARRALKNWVGVEELRKESLWKEIGLPLAGLISTHADPGTQAFAKELSRLWWEDGLMPEKECPSASITDHEGSHIFSAEAGTSCRLVKPATRENLNRLRGITDESGHPSPFMPVEKILFSTRGGGAPKQLSRGFLPIDAESAFAKETDIFSVPGELAAWLRGVRDINQNQFREFQCSAVVAALQGLNATAAMEYICDKGRNLLGEVRWRVKQDKIHVSTELARKLGIEHAPDIVPPPEPQPAPNPQEEARRWLHAVYGVWNGLDAPEKTIIISRYAAPPEVAENLHSDSEDDSRSAWLKLLIFAACHSQGRVSATQACGFITWLENQGHFQTFLDHRPHPDSQDANHAWMNALYRQGERLIEDESRHRDFLFRTQFGAIHRLAWGLDDHRWVIPARADDFGGSARLAHLLRPGNDPYWEGVHQVDEIVPLDSTMGTVGVMVLVRELLRLKVLSPNQWARHGFVPRRRIRQRLAIDYTQTATYSDSETIYRLAEEAIPDDPTFGGHFDIPLMAALNGEFQVNA